MKEKIIQGGIVNGVKMLVCPTWEEDFQTEIHKTGGCLRISMNYSAVDVSYWKELEEIAERYGYDLDEEAKEIINEYVRGNITLTKIDEEYRDNKLTGAEFEVYKFQAKVPIVI